MFKSVYSSYISLNNFIIIPSSAAVDSTVALSVRSSLCRMVFGEMPADMSRCTLRMLPVSMACRRWSSWLCGYIQK